MLERNRRLLGDLPPAAVVRNCIDVAAVRRGITASDLPAHWPEGFAPIVLFLGRLERKKGVEVAFRAFATLADSQPTARLVLAGATGDSRFEPTRQQLLTLLPESARSRVVFLGHVEGPSLYRGIAAASVVVCPSLWEGFGQVALEAKALGSPVVVTSGSGFDDFCVDGDDCLMVPPGDPVRLATAIERLLGDRGLVTALTTRATVGVLDFTADAVAPDLVAAVEDLTVAGTRMRSMSGR
ncbi:hypothetical protein GCM10025867_31120 [Frondihabitans sucicola]|uniref:D-inositol 3-phosphate glycosyltransferase n=1 Tax=Frondihabitans sucicola TaxID=1268041 RepID=A0ABN6Y1H0_9MICO|nr:glycosyltransferase family 4 protein [Frondihabitans sucicola]BDZ50871.1 hypothetical protein GCM10025867_31120 [Frondihabitans sucicola]